MRRSRTLTLLVAVTALAPVAAWAEARLDCSGNLLGDRALVTITGEGMFDRDMLRLIHLGMTGRLRVDVTLLRRRRFWFDEVVTVHPRELLMVWSRKLGRFTLDGEALPDPARWTLPRLSLWPGGKPLSPGAYYAVATARLQVVTAASLAQVAEWLVTGQNGADGGAARLSLSRGLLAGVAGDLARTAETRCSLPRN